MARKEYANILDDLIAEHLYGWRRITYIDYLKSTGEWQEKDEFLNSHPFYSKGTDDEREDGWFHQLEWVKNHEDLWVDLRGEISEHADGCWDYKYGFAPSKFDNQCDSVIDEMLSKGYEFIYRKYPGGLSTVIFRKPDVNSYTISTYKDGISYRELVLKTVLGVLDVK